MFKSVWEYMYDNQDTNGKWVMILENLIPLFRKDSFSDIVKDKDYYPQKTNNCRYYIKPNEGSCGKGITISNTYPGEIDGYIVCPEIKTSLIDGKYKYDFRVWIAISSNLQYYICPTFIQRVSTIEFSDNKFEGSLTNLSLYGDAYECQDDILYENFNGIVKNVLSNLEPNNLDTVMLTGWDFIIDECGNPYVLEVNCSPGFNIQYTQTFNEFLGYLSNL